MILSHFQTEFEKIMKRDYFSSEIHPVREKAFSRFMDIGLPTQKWEDWRFTNLSELKKNDLVNIEIDILSKYVRNYFNEK